MEQEEVVLTTANESSQINLAAENDSEKKLAVSQKDESATTTTPVSEYLHEVGVQTLLHIL